MVMLAALAGASQGTRGGLGLQRCESGQIGGGGSVQAVWVLGSQRRWRNRRCADCRVTPSVSPIWAQDAPQCNARAMVASRSDSAASSRSAAASAAVSASVRSRSVRSMAVSVR